MGEPMTRRVGSEVYAWGFKIENPAEMSRVVCGRYRIRTYDLTRVKRTL